MQNKTLKIVLDTGFLSSLFKIKRLELLKRFFCVNCVYIPNAALKELSRSKFFAEFVSLVASGEDKADENKWIVSLNTKTTEITDERFGPGEREAIALAKELNALLLIDDQSAKKAAEENNINAFSLDVFLKACKAKGLIDAKEMKKILADLKEKDNYNFKSEIEKELMEY